jgi:hypothetical protein
MPRGRRSPLAAEKFEYLESHLAEFQEAQPNLKKFWAKVEKGYFAKWKVEVELGLPILDTEGVSIEDSGVSEEHQTAIGAAQKKVSKVNAFTGILIRSITHCDRSVHSQLVQ